MKVLLEWLGREEMAEEMAVVQEFVNSGNGVMTWKEINDSPRISRDGLESMMYRELIHPSVTIDGSTETLVLDTKLFNHARKVLPVDPPR